MKILVIDDQKVVGWSIEQALFSKIVKVEWVSSGKEGLERVKQTVFDLIFLDVDMPGMDGFETCRRLKSDEMLKSIPVLFISGDATPERQMKGLELGAEYFLSKPFEVGELRFIVSYFMDRKMGRQRSVATRFIP